MGDRARAQNGPACSASSVEIGRRKITPQAIIAEVESAKNFEPKHILLLHRNNESRDIELQKTAREITDTHLRTGLFSVTIYRWEDIIDILAQTGTLGRFYPEVDHVEIKNELRRVSGLLESRVQVVALLVSQTEICVSEIASMVLASEYWGDRLRQTALRKTSQQRPYTTCR